MSILLPMLVVLAVEPSRMPTDVPDAVPWTGEPKPKPEPKPKAGPTPTPAPVAEPVIATALDAPAAAPARTWTVTAFVDTGYALNNNRPDNHLYRGTSTTPRTDEFTINLGAVALTHDATDDEPYRFEFGLQAGSAADALVAGEPVPGGDDGAFAGAETWKHLALANAGGRIAQSGTELGAGLFASPIGIGGFWSPFNANVTPSWASNAAPFYFAGLRVQQDLPAGFGLQAWLVNGWQTLADANGAPSGLVGATWDHHAPSGSWYAAGFVYFGPDDIDLSADAWRVHTDGQVGWRGRRLGVAAVWDYGRERVTALPDAPVQWWTGGGLFVDGRAYEGRRVDVDVAIRPEAWRDRGGRIYGVDQWLLSGTGTFAVRFFDVLLLRAEYRYDRSTADGGFFYRADATSPDAPGLASDQHTVFFNVAGVFAHSFAIGRATPSAESISAHGRAVSHEAVLTRRSRGGRARSRRRDGCATGC